MNLLLIREPSTEKSTIGRLYIDGVFECFTLEDIERKEKIKGKTCIPKGVYQVIIDFSNRFKREMPHILDVPGFEGIRIHSGNKAEDTEGCILVGMVHDKDWVGRSVMAYTSLFSKLDFAYTHKEQISIKIT